MDLYRKERSTKQHMRIDLHVGHQDSSQDGLLLANPMACGNVSPGDSAHHQVTSPKHDVHTSLLNSTSPPAIPGPGLVSEPHTQPQAGTTSSQVVSHSRTNSFENSLNSTSGAITRQSSNNSERSSFRDKSSKNRPKSPSLFRFFVKGHGVGTNSANGSLTNSPMIGNTGGRRVGKGSSVDDEEDYGGDASSNSDHEDPFSVSLTTKNPIHKYIYLVEV